MNLNKKKYTSNYEMYLIVLEVNKIYLNAFKPVISKPVINK